MRSDGPLEQISQLCLLVLAEVSEELVATPRPSLIDPPAQRPALVGQRDRHRSPVGRIGGAADQAQLFETVDHLSGRPWCDVQMCREVAEPQRGAPVPTDHPYGA